MILGFEEYTFKQLYENKYVTPGDVADPKFGWCIIMAGGPGCGKGWCIDHKLLVQGKHFDVDKFKSMYIKMQKDEKYRKDITEKYKNARREKIMKKTRK